MITADKAVELLKDYSQAMEDEEEEKCRIYCEKLYSQKQVNNLEIVDECDEDGSLSFLSYLNELIDLLNHEEAVKLHVEIAKELIQNSYDKIYQCDLYDLPSCLNFFYLIKLWKLTFDECQGIYIEHSRHRSVWNFMVNLFGGLIAYTYLPQKPALDLESKGLPALPSALF
jgi:hypothetical protein